MDQKIRYFLEAAEAGSFSRAARKLFISAQALNKQIRLLESELGKPLFVRSPHGVALTDFGQYARRELARVVQAYDAAIAGLKDFAKSEKEQIRIGVFSALPREKLVLPLVSFLLTRYHDCQFQLEMIELSEGKRKLMEGALDLLLTNVHEQDDLEDYDGLSFGCYEAKVVVSLTHPWSGKDSLTAEDLKSETFLKMKMDADRYTVPWEASFYRNVPCKSVLEAENFETLLVLLSQRAGFAIFPMAFSNVDRAQIKSFDYPGTALLFYTALLYRRNKGNGVISRVIEGVRGEFGLAPFAPRR